MARIYLAEAHRVGDTVALEDAAFRHVARVFAHARRRPAHGIQWQGQRVHRTHHTDRTPCCPTSRWRRSAKATPNHRCTAPFCRPSARGNAWTGPCRRRRELGISAIQPVLTARCNVKLDTERWAKKQAHWQGRVDRRLRAVWAIAHSGPASSGPARRCAQPVRGRAATGAGAAVRKRPHRCRQRHRLGRPAGRGPKAV